MYTPRVRLRITAYQRVVASLVPRIWCHGRGGGPTSGATPLSRSWRCLATLPVAVSMKKTATGPEASAGPSPDARGPGALSEPWRAGLRLFDRDLQRRGAAERTRVAYGADLGELARWADGQGLAPVQISYPLLRRYAAQLAGRGHAPRTMARKLSSIRAFFRILVEHGAASSNPADLLAAPKLPQRLPHILKPAEVAAVLDRIPATTPLELRDRALFELAYAC